MKKCVFTHLIQLPYLANLDFPTKCVHMKYKSNDKDTCSTFFLRNQIR